MSCGGGSISSVTRRSYGYFFDTTEQTASLVNTPYSIMLNTTDLSNGIYITSGSRITFLNTGIYDLQFSAQLSQKSGGTQVADIWLSYTGSNVPNTNTAITVQGTAAKAVAAWDFMFEVKNPYDYVELKWSTPDVGLVLQYATTGSIHPAVPSLIVSVIQI